MSPTTTVGAAEVVTTFLEALEAGDVDHAMALLTEDAVWINVSLPTVHGRAAIERLCRRCFAVPGAGFRVHVHHVAQDGDVVLTERSDAIVLGPVDQRFWVSGRFEVVDGRIRVWRDAFDWADMAVGLARGLAGAVVPALNRRWPPQRR